MAHLESPLPLTISNGCVPPDSFIGPFEGGPSLEVPLTTVLCPSGVSEAWLCSALFRKALFHFLLFQTSDFPKRSIFLATLLQLLPRLNLFALGRLRDSSPTTRQPRMLKRSLQRDNGLEFSFCQQGLWLPKIGQHVGGAEGCQTARNCPVNRALLPCAWLLYILWEMILFGPHYLC